MHEIFALKLGWKIPRNNPALTQFQEPLWISHCSNAEIAMRQRHFGKSLRKTITSRNKTLGKFSASWYKEDVQTDLEESEKRRMGIEPNFCLGGTPLRVDNGLVLDPRLVRIVQALARHAAEEDFRDAIKHQNEGA
ncbi:MAG: hypothetical protein AB7O04_06075 [Hyphomonadaceae bacterium]